jgi:hypothetical protein
MVGEISTSSKRVESKPMSIKVLDTIGRIIFEKHETNHSKFSFTALEGGPHQICIENMGEFATTVEMNIQIGAKAKDYSAVASTKDLRSAELRLKKVQDMAQQIHHELQYLREREEQMRNTNQTIHSRVIGYSVCTILFLLAIAFIQILYLKRFFKAKKVI